MMQEENKKAPRGFCFLDILDRPYACTQTIGVCHAKTEVIHVAPTTPLFELRTRSQTCFFWLDFYATVVCIKRHDIPVSGPSVCQFLKAGGVLPFRFRRNHNASPAFNVEMDGTKKYSPPLELIKRVSGSLGDGSAPAAVTFVRPDTSIFVSFAPVSCMSTTSPVLYVGAVPVNWAVVHTGRLPIIGSWPVSERSLETPSEWNEKWNI